MQCKQYNITQQEPRKQGQDTGGQGVGELQAQQKNNGEQKAYTCRIQRVFGRRVRIAPASNGNLVSSPREKCASDVHIGSSSLVEGGARVNAPVSRSKAGIDGHRHHIRTNLSFSLSLQLLYLQAVPSLGYFSLWLIFSGEENSTIYTTKEDRYRYFSYNILLF